MDQAIAEPHTKQNFDVNVLEQKICLRLKKNPKPVFTTCFCFNSTAMLLLVF